MYPCRSLEPKSNLGAMTVAIKKYFICSRFLLLSHLAQHRVRLEGALHSSVAELPPFCLLHLAVRLGGALHSSVAERPPFCLLHLAVRLGGALHSSVAERPHFCLIHLAASSTATLLLLKEKLLK